MPDADELPDDELIARIARGDRQAFATLYRRRRADVYRFAVHVGGWPSLAEDVTQDVFLTLIPDAEKFQPGRSSALAWLRDRAQSRAPRARA